VNSITLLLVLKATKGKEVTSLWPTFCELCLVAGVIFVSTLLGWL